MIVKNPVRLEGRPGENPERGSQPFKPDEIRKLREHAGPDSLAFALLKWTGFRGSDAVALTWAEVDFDTREIVRVTQKRGKRVVIPIQTELLFVLEAERDRRNPQSWERVLLNPQTSKPFTRMRLYERMLALGRRAGVAGANPHRFRDTLAVEMLVRGATPYDVTKTLGDTIDTVEKTRRSSPSFGSVCAGSWNPSQTSKTWAQNGHNRKRKTSNYNRISGRGYKPDFVRCASR